MTVNAPSAITGAYVYAASAGVSPAPSQAMAVSAESIAISFKPKANLASASVKLAIEPLRTILATPSSELRVN